MRGIVRSEQWAQLTGGLSLRDVRLSYPGTSCKGIDRSSSHVNSLSGVLFSGFRFCRLVVGQVVLVLGDWGPQPSQHGIVVCEDVMENHALRRLLASGGRAWRFLHTTSGCENPSTKKTILLILENSIDLSRYVVLHDTGVEVTLWGLQSIRNHLSPFLSLRV